MKNTKWGNEFRTTTICVDSYENSQLAGRLYNPHLKEGISFSNLMQFLKDMEILLDDMNFPQAFTSTRYFSNPISHSWDGSSEEPMLQGKLATFAVKVLFRQNASWQGSISWIGQGKEQSFRSALELVFLIDSARGEALDRTEENICADDEESK